MSDAKTRIKQDQLAHIHTHTHTPLGLGRGQKGGHRIMSPVMLGWEAFITTATMPPEATGIFQRAKPITMAGELAVCV